MKLTVYDREKKEPMGDLFGIFFEDLNHAADGGLYAELVQNRAFEYDVIDNENYNHLTAWEAIENDGRVSLAVETGNPVTWQNPHYLGMDIKTPGTDVGVRNLGYAGGMFLKEGERYFFSCYARREQDYEKELKISLRSKDLEIYTEKQIFLSKEWKKYELELEMPKTDSSACLCLTLQGRGKVYLDFVSLFPKDTFCGRKNGMRKDLAEKLQELKPKFMRFPGGCLVHCGALDAMARDAQYRWKNTIGAVEERSSRKNNWNYNQSLGIGFYEYFQFCEDIQAKPLPVLPGGYDPHTRHAIPKEELQPWIDDALDLIEFAKGDVNTVWGRKRADLGHPKPFQLEYLGIGNEEVGEEFFERYRIICKAIKEKYPEIKVIGTSGPNAAGGEFERGWKCARETLTDIVDEHYYQNPEWFLAHHHRYDDYSREGSKVFLGEYASWGNTWYHALVESSYMIGLERNAGIVVLSCYAPLLCNVNYMNWKPDMIWFDHKQVVCSANYYVQKLFMHHQGDYRLEISAEKERQGNQELKENEIVKIRGNILLEGYESTVKYSDIRLINEDTKEIRVFDDCVIKKGKQKFLTSAVCSNYTLKMKAKLVEGWKGFRIIFGYQNEKTYLYWVIGGWQNQDTVIGELIEEQSSDYSQYLFEVEKEKEYELELRVREGKIVTVINGKIFHQTEKKPVVIEPLYYSASWDELKDEVIVKITNMKDEAQVCEISLESLKKYSQAYVYQMAGWEKEAENTFENPDRIKEQCMIVPLNAHSFCYEVPGESFVVIRFKK